MEKLGECKGELDARSRLRPMCAANTGKKITWLKTAGSKDGVGLSYLAGQ